MGPRKLTGVVVGTAMQKTIKVEVIRHFVDPWLKVNSTARKKYLAHDEQEQSAVGDRVEIVECRPISKRKRFALNRVLKQDVIARIQKEGGTSDAASSSSP